MSVKPGGKTTAPIGLKLESHLEMVMKAIRLGKFWSSETKVGDSPVRNLSTQSDLCWKHQRSSVEVPKSKGQQRIRQLINSTFWNGAVFGVLERISSPIRHFNKIFQQKHGFVERSVLKDFNTRFCSRELIFRNRDTLPRWIWSMPSRDNLSDANVPIHTHLRVWYRFWSRFRHHFRQNRRTSVLECLKKRSWWFWSRIN